MRYRPGQARRRLDEFERLKGAGVSDDAALVIADAVAFQPWLRGDTAAAYSRHRAHASPLARQAWAHRARENRAGRRA